jgi:hypothetical protein
MSNCLLYIYTVMMPKVYGQTAEDLIYVPNPASPSGPTVPTIYPPGTIPAWYANLEKYWFYRYRLVNDFMIYH